MRGFKKILSVLMIAALLSFSFNFVMANAAEYTANGITYTDISGSECKITKVSTTVRGNVVIPDSVNGKKVVEITSDAFSNNLAITSIELPNTIKTVRAAAFKGCAALQSVKFSGPVNTFGNSVFSGCTSLSDIVLPEKMNIIPKETFYGCSTIKNIEIQPTVKTIGSSAFVNCNSLTEVFIPKSVNLINEKAFHACSSIQSFTVEEGNMIYKSVDSSLLSIDGTEFISYPCGLKQSIFTVPDGVTDIDYGAFASADIAKIILPDSLVNIEDYAFQYNEKLTSINIPYGTEKIGSHAFENCSRLKLIAIPSTVKEYSNAFIDSGLTTMIIEDGAKSVSDHAFENCTQLKRVVLPDSVESIGTAAFYLCSGLESVIIPASVTEINTDAFKNCDSVLLYVEENSYAQKYAENNNIRYEIYVGASTQVGICVENLPEKTLYTPGEEFDPAGIKVSLVYADGDVKNLNPDEYQLKCDELNEPGNHSVTVTYKEFTDSFTVSVARILALRLDSSECKTVYHVGEKFDDTGLKVYLEYSNGSKILVDNYSIENQNFSEAGTYSIRVSIGDVSETIDVTVSAMKAIKVKALPSKTDYNYKQTLDPSGLKIVAVYEDGSESELKENEYTLSNTYFSKVGTASIKVSCENLVTSFNVNVKYAFWQIIIRIVLFGFLWY